MRFKVFISGNQTELREERFAVKDAIQYTPIIRNFFQPFLFEDLPAGGRDAVSTFLAEVKSSDVYVGILGDFYGSKNEDSISATELEYNTFSETVTDGEILIFIKGHDDDLRDSEINLFFKKTKKLSTYKRFDSIEDLKEKIILSLEAFLISEGVINAPEFDARSNQKIDYDAIDEDEVRDFLDKRAINRDLRVPNIPIKNILDSLNLLDDLKGQVRPINTAILFFSKHASEYFPQNEIRIARFDGMTKRAPIIDSQEIKAPFIR